MLFESEVSTGDVLFQKRIHGDEDDISTQLRPILYTGCSALRL